MRSARRAPGPRTLSTTLGLILLLALVAAASSGADSATPAARAGAGWSFAAKVLPRALPAASPAPATLSLSSASGAGAAGLRELTIELDRSLRLDVGGFPTCKPGKIQARSPAQAKAICRRALLGHGSETIEVAFSEAQPVRSRGSLLVFNAGRKGGAPVFLVYANFSAPLASVSLTEVKARRTGGRFGTKLAVPLPTIAGGSGSVVSFGLTLHKRFHRRGKAKSVVGASCPSGRLRFRATARFVDGTSASRSASSACHPRP